MFRLIRFGARWSMALALSAWSLTLGLAFRRSRALLDAIVRHFGWERLLGESISPRLPTATLESLFPELDAPMVLATPRDGNIAPLELAAICALVRARKPRAVFEIGTFDGRTTANLARNSPPDAVVYTLDLTPGADASGDLAPGDAAYARKSHVGARLTEVDTATRTKIVQLYGDSAIFDFSPYAGSIDFVFVDGSHHEDYVRNDTAKALELVALGGMVVWHDYANAHWLGVTRALDDLSSDPRLSRARHIAGTTLVVCEVATG
ncbi:class I SAM-dependent methyltransferase [Candidatus Poribacteria bacterium]|nr:class I SAM-dependent methyltransferase [Candidatus Poribacteria bacterium]